MEEFIPIVKAVKLTGAHGPDVIMAIHRGQLESIDDDRGGYMVRVTDLERLVAEPPAES